MSSMKYLLAFAIVATLATSAFAVQCYICESVTNPKCGENFEGDASFKVDCSRVAAARYLQTLFTGGNRNATGCMKKTLEAVGGHPQIVRSCFYGNPSHTQEGCMEDPSLPFVKQLSCDVCTGDLCNSSTATGPIALTILAFFALARLFS
ncbi:hypothetical protein DOY81_006376 [Sarcophaga bullata]|nr:hypothetical protein DOY81_006376 [Sarcophaga bullata]